MRAIEAGVTERKPRSRGKQKKGATKGAKEEVSEEETPTPTPKRRGKSRMADTALTMSVPSAGKLYFGLGRNGSYAAAARGDIPTVRIGPTLRVPIRKLEAMLDQAGEKPAA